MKKAFRSLFGKKKSSRNTIPTNGPLLTENETIEHRSPLPLSHTDQGSSSGITSQNFGSANEQLSTESSVQLLNEDRAQPLNDRSSMVIHHSRPESYDPRSVREIIQLQQRIRELEMGQQVNMQLTRDPGPPQKFDKGHSSGTAAPSSITGPSHQVNASHPSRGREQESRDVVPFAESGHHRSSHASMTTNMLSNTLPVVRPLVDRSRVGLNHTSREPPALHVGDIPGQRRLYSQDPVAPANGGLTSTVSKESMHSRHSVQERYRQSAPAGPIASKNEGTQTSVATIDRGSCSAQTYHCKSIYGSGNPYVYYGTSSRVTSLSADTRETRTASPYPLYSRRSPNTLDQGSSLVPEKTEVTPPPSSPSPLADHDRDPSSVNTASSMPQGIVLDGEGNLKSTRGKRIRKTLSIHWNSKEKTVSSKVVLPEADERHSQRGTKTASAAMGVPPRACSLSRVATSASNNIATKKPGAAIPSLRGPRAMPDIQDHNQEPHQFPQKTSPATDANTTNTQSAILGGPSSEAQRRVFNRVTVESENGMSTTTSTSRSGSCSEEDEDKEREDGSSFVSYTRLTPERRRYCQRLRRTSSPKLDTQAMQQQQLQQTMMAALRITTSSVPRISMPHVDTQRRENQGKALTAMDEFVKDTEDYIRKHEKSIEINPYHVTTEQHLREQAFFYAQRKAKERRILRTQSQEDAQSPVLSPAQIPSQGTSKEAARTSTSASASLTNSILKKITTSSRVVGPIKRPTLDSVIGGNIGVSRSTPASLVPIAKRNSNTLSNSNTTASRGVARRIVYSADLEQGLPKGRVAREGNFEIVPQTRGLCQLSSHSTGHTSAAAARKKLSGYETEIYPDYAPKEEISDEEAKRVVVSHGVVLIPQHHQHAQISQDGRALPAVSNTGN